MRTGRLKKNKSRYSDTKESLTLWEKVRHERSSRQARVMIGIGAVMIIVLITLVLGTSLISGKKGVKTQSSQAFIEEKADAIENLEQLRGTLKSTLAAYLAADTIEEKLKYIRRQDVVLPLMVRYYERNPHELKKTELMDVQVVTRMYQVNKIVEGRYIYVTGGLTLDGKVTPFIIEEVNGKFAVDWETHVAYNPMTRDQLLDQRPPEPMPFRVYLNSSDRYIEPFNLKEHIALQLVFPDKIETVDAFIDRANPDALYISKALQSGRLMPVILKLRIPPEFDGRAVLVDSFVQPRWFISK